jgi:dipeptidyl aminopeptidase/acylaminoacyl peptidase
VKVHTLDRLPFRHWDEWWETQRHHVFVADVTTGATRDVTPGDFDSPPHNYEDAAIAFSPDSKEIAFVSKRDGKDSEMWTTNHDVWTVSVTGGSAKKLTTGNPAADFQPTYTKDGKSIVVRAQRRAGFEADRWYLEVYDRTGSKRVFETDLSVDFKFSPDGKTIWFTRRTRPRISTFAAGSSPTLSPAVRLKCSRATASRSIRSSAGHIRVAPFARGRPSRENATWLGGRGVEGRQ